MPAPVCDAKLTLVAKTTPTSSSSSERSDRGVGVGVGERLGVDVGDREGVWEGVREKDTVLVPSTLADSLTDKAPLPLAPIVMLQLAQEDAVAPLGVAPALKEPTDALGDAVEIGDDEDELLKLTELDGERDCMLLTLAPVELLAQRDATVDALAAALAEAQTLVDAVCVCPDSERAALELGLAQALDELLRDELGDSDGDGDGGCETRPESEDDAVGLELAEPPPFIAALAEAPTLALVNNDCVENIVDVDKTVTVLLERLLSDGDDASLVERVGVLKTVVLNVGAVELVASTELETEATNVRDEIRLVESRGVGLGSAEVDATDAV
jgi:hypothetical protein